MFLKITYTEALTIHLPDTLLDVCIRKDKIIIDINVLYSIWKTGKAFKNLF